jgi:hypothetical protein
MMHESDSTIRVPVDVGIEAAGQATREGKLAPHQRFLPVDRSLKPGDVLLNAGTLKLYTVLAVTDAGVWLQTDAGPATFSWEDVQAAAWQVRES